jgi:hypothetical protein
MVNADQFGNPLFIVGVTSTGGVLTRGNVAHASADVLTLQLAGLATDLHFANNGTTSDVV